MDSLFRDFNGMGRVDGMGINIVMEILKRHRIGTKIEARQENDSYYKGDVISDNFDGTYQIALTTVSPPPKPYDDKHIGKEITCTHEEIEERGAQSHIRDWFLCNFFHDILRSSRTYLKGTGYYSRSRGLSLADRKDAETKRIDIALPQLDKWLENEAKALESSTKLEGLTEVDSERIRGLHKKLIFMAKSNPIKLEGLTEADYERIKDLYGKFASMVTSMGRILFCFSLWLCLATIRPYAHGRSTSALSMLLDLVATFWYLIFGVIMYTSCMLWDTMILKVYPMLAKAEITRQFNIFRDTFPHVSLTSNVETTTRVSAPRNSRNNTPGSFRKSSRPKLRSDSRYIEGPHDLEGMSVSLDDDAKADVPVSRLDIAKLMSFQNITEMNGHLASHHDVTQFCENINTIILVFGLSSLELGECVI